jgi:hypothetical protein
MMTGNGGGVFIGEEFKISSPGQCPFTHSAEE